MKLTILTVCPTYFDSMLKNQVLDRAVKTKALDLHIEDIRSYTKGSFRAIDDSPYGGGNGMILRVDSLCNALNAVKGPFSHVVLLSPKGCVYKQSKAKDLCKYEDLVIVCGHFEGCDARFEKYVDEIISIGDFILTGGESAAMVITDSVARLLPGVMKDNVTTEESFEDNLLEHKQYTHPFEYDGESVPPVLLSGDPKKISAYKKQSSLEETLKFRPDLINNNNR